MGLHVPMVATSTAGERCRSSRMNGRKGTMCAANRNRLIGEGVTESTADASIAAWQARAAQDGIELGSAQWQAGWDWIGQQGVHRVPTVANGPAADISSVDGLDGRCPD
jgi:hypothetical protein